eukprot:COSAG06_NODE_78650_length_109_cov_1668.100000_1_plen_32_part_01
MLESIRRRTTQVRKTPFFLGGGGAFYTKSDHF